MVINESITQELVNNGYCESPSIARRIQVQMSDEDALNRWKQRQDNKGE